MHCHDECTHHHNLYNIKNKNRLYSCLKQIEKAKLIIHEYHSHVSKAHPTLDSHHQELKNSVISVTTVIGEQTTFSKY